MSDSLCTTCSRPANAGYKRIVSGRMVEMCCDPCHGPHLQQISESMRWFCNFHGRKAKKMLRYVA